jgi:hypothetical protein
MYVSEVVSTCIDEEHLFYYQSGNTCVLLKEQ